MNRLIEEMKDDMLKCRPTSRWMTKTAVYMNEIDVTWTKIIKVKNNQLKEKTRLWDSNLWEKEVVSQPFSYTRPGSMK